VMRHFLHRCRRRRRRRRRRHHHLSCPDLSELQSLHTMHPLLCKQYLSPSQY
jgi:hypothetical protein